MTDEVKGTLEPIVGSHVKRPKYPPKWLTTYAGLQKMPPKDALEHVLKKNRTTAEAARELKIAPLTLYRNLKKWGVTVER